MTDEQKDAIIEAVARKQMEVNWTYNPECVVDPPKRLWEEADEDERAFWRYNTMLYVEDFGLWELIEVLEEIAAGRWTESGDWPGATHSEIRVGKMAEKGLEKVVGWEKE